MKKELTVFLLGAALGLASCGTGTTPNEPQPAEANEPAQTITIDREALKARTFDQLFDSISVKEIPGEPFTLIGEKFGILTAGKAERFNSMVTSWGGWGILFGKPAIFHFLRSNRYTLEFMRQEQRYTVSFFEDEFKEDILLFGKKSGRDSDKMKETKLTAVQTPSGRTTYKEASLVLECNLVEVTTVSPDDFYTEEGRKFVVDAHAETGEYHKMVFGEITNVWRRKP